MDLVFGLLELLFDYLRRLQVCGGKEAVDVREADAPIV